MPEKERVQLDASLYEKFKPLGAMQAYEYLDGDKAKRSEQRRLFEANEIRNPNLDYPKIEPQLLQTREQELLSLKSEIIKSEPDETVKQVYCWKINEKIAEIRMLQATASGDMRRFKKYSEFVYGTPSPDIFAYTVNSVRTQVHGALTNGSAELQKSATELLEILPTEIPHRKVAEIPTQAEVDRAKQATLDTAGDLIAVTDEKEAKAEAIKAAFDGALTTLQADGWQVVLDNSSKSGISVDQEKQMVKVPESRTTSSSKLQTLIVHEIGTHVKRRVNGERSKLKLLGLGLDRYESGEEGVATMREQALGGKVDDYAGLDGHLAIGLAHGLDGEPRDFRGVYEVLKKYYEFNQLLKGEPTDKAAEKAWNRTVRTFRGTDCNVPGTCFTKDIIYREGNIGVWNVIRENPEEMIKFDIGKYDPSNPRHTWILEKLGITDQDLL